MENNQLQINIMGSKVAKGFKCKPKVLDKNKPIMHYKNIIYICSDKRCSNTKNKKEIEELRQILKQMDLDTGQNRIKISKAFCYGACRFKQVANIYSNTNKNGLVKHNNIWLKQTNNYNIKKWKQLFIALKNNKDLTNFKQIDMKIYEKQT